MKSAKVSELKVPPPVLERGGTEVLRAFIDGDGGLCVMFQRAFENPDTWGILLVDVARHVARGYSDGETAKERAAFASILSMLEAELNKPTDLGSTSPVNQ